MIRNILKTGYYFFLKLFFKKCYETKGTAAPITLKTFFFQKILGFNRSVYWPVHFTSIVSNPKNIKIGIGTAPGLSPGCYIQGGGQVFLGDYTIVGPNVGIISANHDLNNYNIQEIGTVVIGDYCWIGMNSVVLPNTELGDHTIVAAGSVVTKSFKEGYCVVGGTPAKILKRLEKETIEKPENKYKYYGYITKGNFKKYRKRKLNV